MLRTDGFAFYWGRVMGSSNYALYHDRFDVISYKWGVLALQEFYLPCELYPCSADTMNDFIMFYKAVAVLTA